MKEKNIWNHFKWIEVKMDNFSFSIKSLDNNKFSFIATNEKTKKLETVENISLEECLNLIEKYLFP
jgi:hypothetical protein